MVSMQLALYYALKLAYNIAIFLLLFFEGLYYHQIFLVDRFFYEKLIFKFITKFDGKIMQKISSISLNFLKLKTDSNLVKIEI